MLRSRLLTFVGALALTTLGSIDRAHATTAILPSGAALPLDQRVAVAVSTSQTTIWTNLRLDTATGPVGLLMPVPPGAALDHSSDAWFEALDDATAPRVFPPSGSTYVCPGTSPDPNADPFHVTTYPFPMAGLLPTKSAILSDVPAVLAWASANGFSVTPATSAALEGMPGMRFFVERFDPTTAPFFTSTLRVVLPSSTPVVPLALTHAGAGNLRVTAWFIGAGRATLTGSTPLKLQMNDLEWIASSQTSNYDEMRDAALVAAGPAASVTETASHDALVKNVPIAGGKGSITGVVTGYFQRTAKYFDGDANPSSCILNAGVMLDSSLDVAKACPRANLGVVDGAPSCVEAPSGSEVDPAKLRCGGRADDLAVALSDLQPSSTWLTRMTMVIPKETSGQTWPIMFTAVAPQADPSETASSISFAGCSSTSTSSSSSSGSTSTSSSSGGPWTTSSGVGGNPPSTYQPTYDPDMACGCGGPAAPVIIDDTAYGGYGGAGGGGGSGGDAYYDSSSDDCSGSTTDSTDPTYSDTSSSDDCDGSTTDSTESSSSDSSSSDDCDGSTTDSTTSSDTSSSSSDGIDCSSDTGGSGGSDTSSSSDSSDSSDCTVAQHSRAKPHKRGPKASVLALGLFAILAPLRRLGRPRRPGHQQKDKPVPSRSR